MHTRLALLYALSTSLLAVACDPDGDSHEPARAPETLAPALDAVLDQAVEDGAVGVGLYVSRPGHEPYSQARGLANLATGEALTPDHLFRIASMSKPYLGALIVKLAVEGKLSLDDRMTEYLPADLTARIPHAESITIYDLLTMWSGIADYRDMDFTLDVVLGDHGKVRDEYTDLIDGLDRSSAPCSVPEVPLEAVTEEIAGCLYTNTNYVLLGYIADRVLYGVEPGPGPREHHHSEAFREMFFAPLGLESTYYEKHLAPGESFMERLAHGYFTLTPELGGTELTDVTGWDDGNGYANGGLIATAADVATFRRAMFDREQAFPMQDLREKARFLELLTTTNPMGVAPGGVAVHEYWLFAGDISGYTSISKYSPTRDTTIVFYSNDRDVEASRDAIVAQIEAIVASEHE